MKVKCKSSNRFLIKDEWYKVININDVDNGGYSHPEEYKEATPGRSVHYEIENHTDKNWNTSWYHEVNFYTLEEVRELKLNDLGI
jgi:hypothetical protein